MKKIFVFISILSILGLVLIPVISFSKQEKTSDCQIYCSDTEKYELSSDIVCICNPLGTQSFEGLINNIINFLFRISLIIAPLMFIFAGFLFVTSEGNPEKVKQAKDLIWWTIIGFVIILLARGLVEMLQSMLGVS